jgi:signal transduction histidine kinase
MSRPVSDVARIFGLAVVYVATAQLGLAFDAVAGFATLVWPPSGLAIAALILFGIRLWPGILIGAAIANFMTGAPVLVALGIGAGNTLEALAAVYLLRRTPAFIDTLETVTSAVGLVLAAVSSTLIAATVGVLMLSLGHIVASSELLHTWRAWWIGDMVGVLLVAPLVLVWWHKPRARFHHWRGEAVALAVALVLVSAATFFSDPTLPLNTPFHHTGALLAVLIWAALRFGERGAATAAFAVSAAAVAATTLGHGPFVERGLSNSLLSLQTFMSVVGATLLLLGATIAERRFALEEARWAHDEAERANRVKSEFLAVMSHELRTPLTAIAGYAELLSDGVYGPLNEQETEAVHSIHRSEQHLLSIVEEILGFVSAEKGEIAVAAEDIPIAAAFDDVEPLVQPDLQGKHFVLERRLALPRLAVHADRRSLRQILVNLIANASKYTADGGKITLGADRDGSTVRIWVRDTGVGISGEELQRVFEPFFQSERGLTRRYSGVGLGLTIARDLARRMEGDVTLASTVGSGTTATVVLPAA